MNLAIKRNEAQVLAALARQPQNLKLLAEDHAKMVADRQASVDRIKALDAQSEAEWAKSQRAIESATAKFREAERKLREASEALFEANAARSRTRAEYTNAREAEEATLIATADIAAIEAWKTALIDEHTALQRPNILAYGQSTERDPVTRKTVHHGFSNASGIVALMKALLEAYYAADLLKFEPDQSRLPAIFAAARASWPRIDSPVI